MIATLDSSRLAGCLELGARVTVGSRRVGIIVSKSESLTISNGGLYIARNQNSKKSKD